MAAAAGDTEVPLREGSANINISRLCEENGISYDAVAALSRRAPGGEVRDNFKQAFDLAKMIMDDPALEGYVATADRVDGMACKLRRYIDKVHITSCVLKYLLSFGVNNLASPTISGLIANGEGTIWLLLPTALLRASIISVSTSAGHFVLRSHSIKAERLGQQQVPDPRSNVGCLLKFLYFVVAYVQVTAVVLILLDLATVRNAMESKNSIRVLTDFLTRIAMLWPAP